MPSCKRWFHSESVMRAHCTQCSPALRDVSKLATGAALLWGLVPAQPVLDRGVLLLGHRLLLLWHLLCHLLLLLVLLLLLWHFLCLLILPLLLLIVSLDERVK